MRLSIGTKSMNLPVQGRSESSEEAGGCGTSCGTSCGAGLEKIYPTTAVRFGAMRWLGEFSYRPGTVFRCGAKVVVQSERGIELGEQVSLTCNGCSKSVSREQIRRYIDNSGAEFYRLNSGRILREATPQDLDEHARLNGTVMEDVDRAALLAAQLDLEMRIVTVEHLLGGERIVFYFRSKSRVDFRQMVRLLAEHYRTRIEMRQVAERDEARLVADYEVCGRECCCRTFLKKLRPVSMKMAKVQKATLDPSKVSGRCGRLRCCLRYEHEGYEVLDRKLPRINARVGTEHGPGTVIDRQILTQLVLVRIDDERVMTFPVEELIPIENAPAAAAPLSTRRRPPPNRRGPSAPGASEAPGATQNSISSVFEGENPGGLTDEPGARPPSAAQPRHRRGRRRRGRMGPNSSPDTSPPDPSVN